MNLLRRLSRRGAAIQDDRVFLFAPDEEFSFHGFCRIGKHKFPLVPSERFSVLESYEKTPTPTHFPTLVQNLFHSRGASFQKTKNTLQLPTLPQPCAFYGGHMFVPGGDDAALFVLGDHHHLCRQGVPSISNGSVPLHASGNTVTVPVSAYTILHEGKTYAFPPTSLSLDYRERDGITLGGPPYTRAGYDNPVVWEDGSICYNGHDRWEDLGIQFGIPLPLEKAARQAARALREAREVLTTYFGTVRKVRSIEIFSGGAPCR